MNKNNKVIFKNTLFLYARTIILVLVSLYSVRLVLAALGENDYGTYNVVYGFVAMFTFVTGVMINSSQRHFSVSLAKDDWDSVNRLFSVNMVIYLFYSIILIILAETVGLWFVIDKLNYPPEQVNEVIWVYQFSIITIILTMFSSPFVALLMANEHMIVYAIASIIESAMKLIIALILVKIDSSRMLFYALLMMVSSLLVNAFYILYGRLRYKQIHIYFVREKAAYKEVFSFLNWNLIGGSAAALKSQGINILMNINFGSSVNAARSIAYQVNTNVASFSQNFMKAVDPRIIKSYAQDDMDMFSNYIFSASKLSFYLLMVLCIPFITNMDYVLNLWLEEVPQYTDIFMILVLVDSLILSITDPLLTGVQATGRVKWYQIIVGSLSLLNLPLALLFIKLTGDPYTPFYVAIGISILMTITRIVIFKKMIPYFSVTKYFLQVILPMVIITAAVTAFDYFVLKSAGNFWILVLNCFLSLMLSLVLIFFLALRKYERKAIYTKINKILKKKKHLEEATNVEEENDSKPHENDSKSEESTDKSEEDNSSKPKEGENNPPDNGE